jgi:polysaccharide export outer membrane protein
MKSKMLIIGLFMLLASRAYGDDYVIGEGDALNISVWGNKELSLVVKVRPDGKITIPALGEISAADLTARELQESLSEKMKKMVKNPVVTVIVEGISNNKVYIFGGGVKPGVFDLTRRTTLLQLLCVEGDLANTDLHEAYVLRGGKIIKKDFYKLFNKGATEEDLVIKPNDVVFFPALADKNIYVIGAVNTPKFVVFREGLTVMEAILEAGNFTKFARENSTVILRKEGGKEVTIPVRLKNLVNDGDLSQNVKLRPGDYIVVKEGIF